jgi:hypothetical protein
MRTEIAVGRKSFGDFNKVLQDAKNWHNRKFDSLARFFRRIIFICIQASNFMTLRNVIQHQQEPAKWDPADAIGSRVCEIGFPAAEQDSATAECNHTSAG